MNADAGNILSLFGRFIYGYLVQMNNY